MGRGAIVSSVHQFMMSPSRLVSTVDKDPPVITHCTRLPHFCCKRSHGKCNHAVSFAASQSLYVHVRTQTCQHIRSRCIIATVGFPCCRCFPHCAGMAASAISHMQSRQMTPKSAASTHRQTEWCRDTHLP